MPRALDFTFNADGLPSRMLMIPELARFCHVAPSTVWAAVADGSIAVVRIGGATRVAPQVAKQIIGEGFVRQEAETTRKRGRPQKDQTGKE